MNIGGHVLSYSLFLFRPYGYAENLFLMEYQQFDNDQSEAVEDHDMFQLRSKPTPATPSDTQRPQVARVFRYFSTGQGSNLQTRDFVRDKLFRL